MTEMTRAWVPFLGKGDKQADGSILVRGIATDSTLDADDQICDADWLKTAMPSWFKYGNIREQHSSIAAGVATEYGEIDGQHSIVARIVDPSSVKKIEAGVLKGFSIGIANSRVSTDKSALGGRIVGGDIVEVSIVDRPANPAAVLQLAKAFSAMPVGSEISPADIDGTLVKVESLTETPADETVPVVLNEKALRKTAAKAVRKAIEKAASTKAPIPDPADDKTLAKSERKSEKRLARMEKAISDLAAAVTTISESTVEVRKAVDVISKAPATPTASRMRLGAAPTPDEANTSERARLLKMADATEDRSLAQGYRELAADLLPSTQKD